MGYVSPILITRAVLYSADYVRSADTQIDPDQESVRVKLRKISWIHVV